MKSLINNLVGKNIYILSPHLDDAVLSCGTLLNRLSGKSRITVINFFTKADSSPYSPSALAFLRTCGFPRRPADLYAARVTEDNEVLTGLGIRVINLGLSDGLFRRTGRRLHYPTYRGHLVRGLSSLDQPLMISAYHRLVKILPSRAILLIPLGIGKHADHLFTRQVGEWLSPAAGYYTDYPYALRGNSNSLIGYLSFSLPFTAKKSALISGYRTQLFSLFRGLNPPPLPETYYFPGAKQLISRIYPFLPSPVEKSWNQLWHRHPQPGFANSPATFLSALAAFTGLKPRISAVFSGTRLVAITGLFLHHHWGLPVISPYPVDFSFASPLLVGPQFSRALPLLINPLSDLAPVYLPHQLHTQINSLSHYGIPFAVHSAGINYVRDLSIPLAHRDRFLRSSRKAEGQWRLHTYSGINSGQLSQVFNLDLFSRKQHRGYAYFFVSSHRRFYQELAARFSKFMRIHLLTLADQPIAYDIGFQIAGRYHGSQLSIHDQFSRFAPGRQLLALLIDHLSARGISILDFGSGGNFLKQTLATSSQSLFDVLITPRRATRIRFKSAAVAVSALQSVFIRWPKLYYFYRHLKP